MTMEEIFELVVESPHAPYVMCSDSRMGLLIRTCRSDGKCGVQVPGEEDIRWIGCSTLIDMGGGALMEVIKP